MRPGWLAWAAFIFAWKKKSATDFTDTTDLKTIFLLFD